MGGITSSSLRVGSGKASIEFARVYQMPQGASDVESVLSTLQTRIMCSANGEHVCVLLCVLHTHAALHQCTHTIEFSTTLSQRQLLVRLLHTPLAFRSSSHELVGMAGAREWAEIITPPAADEARFGALSLLREHNEARALVYELVDRASRLALAHDAMQREERAATATVMGTHCGTTAAKAADTAATTTVMLNTEPRRIVAATAAAK